MQIFLGFLVWARLLKDHSLILGGDLNLTLLGREASGESTHQYPLAHYFCNLFGGSRMVDVESIPLEPTWRNGRSGSVKVP